MTQSLADLLGLTPVPRDPARDARIGAALRRSRLQTGRTVEDVAAAAGMTSEQLTRIEDGAEALTVVAAPHVARAVGVSISQLLAE